MGAQIALQNVCHGPDCKTDAPGMPYKSGIKRQFSLSADAPKGKSFRWSYFAKCNKFQ
jgi:hypothetical protein